MKEQWEWKVIKVGLAHSIEHKLNELAKEGWLVESIVPAMDSVYTVFLKRMVNKGERLDESS